MTKPTQSIGFARPVRQPQPGDDSGQRVIFWSGDDAKTGTMRGAIIEGDDGKKYNPYSVRDLRTVD